MTTMNTIKEY